MHIRSSSAVALVGGLLAVVALTASRDVSAEDGYFYVTCPKSVAMKPQAPTGWAAFGGSFPTLDTYVAEPHLDKWRLRCNYKSQQTMSSSPVFLQQIVDALTCSAEKPGYFRCKRTPIRSLSE